MTAALLARLQGGLERLYRVATGLDVRDFVVDDDARTRALAGSETSRAPREQLLVAEADGALELGLFVDGAALANLARHDPADRLGDHNLGDFLLAVEGVSHFVYAAWCAQGERSTSALELELQAEVDKYVTCLLTTDGDGGAGTGASAHWRHRLFDDVRYEPDLDADERSRYAAANDGARRYAASLERRFVTGQRLVEMFAELRRFYRLPLAGKLGHIAGT